LEVSTGFAGPFESYIIFKTNVARAKGVLNYRSASNLLAPSNLNLEFNNFLEIELAGQFKAHDNGQRSRRR